MVIALGELHGKLAFPKDFTYKLSNRPRVAFAQSGRYIFWVMQFSNEGAERSRFLSFILRQPRPVDNVRFKFRPRELWTVGSVGALGFGLSVRLLGVAFKLCGSLVSMGSMAPSKWFPSMVEGGMRTGTFYLASYRCSVTFQDRRLRRSEWWEAAARVRLVAQSFPRGWPSDTRVAPPGGSDEHGAQRPGCNASEWWI